MSEEAGRAEGETRHSKSASSTGGGPEAATSPSPPAAGTGYRGLGCTSRVGEDSALGILDAAAAVGGAAAAAAAAAVAPRLLVRRWSDLCAFQVPRKNLSRAATAFSPS